VTALTICCIHLLLSTVARSISTLDISINPAVLPLPRPPKL
jgi:hypothetical protein